MKSNNVLVRLMNPIRITRFMGQLWSRFQKKPSFLPTSSVLTVSLLSTGKQKHIYDRFQLQKHQLLETRKSSIAGEGVFLKKDVPVNTILEICTILNLSDEDGLCETIDYVFRMADGRIGLALGMISMVNHSDFPNCEIFFNMEGDKMSAVLVSAFPLKAEQELTISYGNQWWRMRPHLRKH